MQLEPLAFKNATEKDHDLAWKILNKLFAKGEKDTIRDLLENHCYDFLSFIESASPSKDQLISRIIKSSDLSTIERICQKHPEPISYKKQLIDHFFGSLCESKGSSIIHYLFDSENTIELNPQQWTQALLKRRWDILDHTSFKVHEQRALSFIDSYFFDLQLTHLKYLEPAISKDKWSLRMARNAISKNKGPAVVSFFIDKGFEKMTLNEQDIWETLFESIKNQNTKAFDKVLYLLQTQGRSFNFEKTSLVSDFTIELPKNPKDPPEEALGLKIPMNKTPLHLKTLSLAEFAWIKGDLDMAQKLLDHVQLAPFLNSERVDQWRQHFETINKQKRVNAKVVNVLNANLDLLLMQASAQRINVTPLLVPPRQVP